MRETWVQSLGQEDPLEKEMATHSSIFAWRIPWVEEPGGLQSTGSQRLSDFTLTLMIGLRVIELLKRMQLILSGFFFLAILHRITFGNFYIAFIRICLQCRSPRFDPWVGKIPLEKEMTIHSIILAWWLLWTEEPGGLQLMGSQSWTRLSDFTFR